MGITTLIFDLGGVLITGDAPYHTSAQKQEFCSHVGSSFEKLSYAGSIVWPKYKIGKITEDEFWEEFLTRAEATNKDVQYGKKFWREHQIASKSMFRLLTKLILKYRLFALTNISKEWLAFKREKFFLDTYFEEIVGSGDIGYAKPDPKIYELFFKKVSVNPVNTLLIDNTAYNLIPAQKLGMQAILFTGKDALEKKFDACGVIYT